MVRDHTTKEVIKEYTKKEGVKVLKEETKGSISNPPQTWVFKVVQINKSNNLRVSF